VAPLAPGGTIGILGGGQLGRMTALAAARLGYRVHVFCPEPDSPTAQVSAAATVGPYTDAAALARFAAAVDVATFEFENIPLAAVRAVAERVCLRPGLAALQIAQDRLREKDFLAGIGIPTTAYRGVGGAVALAAAVADMGGPCVLKTVRMGYDGKGQVRIDDAASASAAWSEMGSDSGIVEALVDFACEVSVVLARGADGRIARYVPVENRHVDHILATTVVPAALSPDVQERAGVIAERIAEALDLVGLLATEMFVTRDGAVLVNEIAPRPHNSGHWTIDACAVSQFEQLVRAVCGLTLGAPERHADAVMENLIGDAVMRWPDLIADPAARLHLYGKAEVRPGRKMGHVTRLVSRR
jgi:5-(carboxyamino)imidazole ribonucleotide synthase